jgi:arsenite-transporting ATPase
MSRLILISGKGGVGKTTLATATGALAASQGRRVLVASLDRAHNLADVLGTQVGVTPTRVAAESALFAIEIDPQEELRRQWGTLQQWFGELLRYLGASDLVADELAILPGLEELLVLTRLSGFITSGDFDLVVADLAPTASSLRYLSFPDLVGGRLGAWVRMDQRFAKIFRPLLKKASLPVPEDGAYQNFYELADQLDRLRQILQDSARASVRLVMTAEPMVLEETRRAHTLFELFGIHVDAVIVNRLLSADVAKTALASWLDIQAKVLAEAKEAFVGLPILSVPFQPTEVKGERALATLGAHVFAERQALDVLAPPRGVSFSSSGAHPTVSVFLPHTKTSPPDLKRRDRDLVISIGGWRRTLALPDSFARQKITAAKIKGDQLEITFSPTDGRTA